MRRLRLSRTAALPIAALVLPGSVAAQLPVQQDDRPSATPVVSAIEIDNLNVFSEEEAGRHWLYRTANSLRFKTRKWVVRREILIASGQPADSARLAETERNLRAMGLFRDVAVDTVRRDGRLVARVITTDAWSTKPTVSGSFATDGTLTGVFGLTETNFLGTGNLVRGAYRKEADRDGADLRARWRRIFGTELVASGSAFLLSDGSSGAWLVGDPWRSMEDRTLFVVGGRAADRRRLRYRALSAGRRDTMEFRQHVYRQDLTAGRAVIARQDRVLRLGLVATYRNERILAAADSAPAPPDSVFADVGLFISYIRPRFRVVNYLDGLNRQDVDLSTGITVAARLAPRAFGYPSTGIGPAISFRTGLAAGHLMLRADLAANGLFNAGGLDSGKVVLTVTGARPAGERHMTLLRVQGGLLENPAPGNEFDLGFSVGPRGFEPHSFVGTRAAWGTLEHRWLAFPNLFRHFGLGIAGYFDFGGAWYPDQDARWGAEVGIGVRTASRLGATARSNRIDLGYLIGPGLDGNRFVLSASSGVKFF